MQRTTKAWICGALTAMLWGNTIAIFLTALAYGVVWSEIQIYFAALFACATGVMGFASGVATAMYGDF